jgi:protein-disulfide isomerase
LPLPALPFHASEADCCNASFTLVSEHAVIGIRYAFVVILSLIGFTALGGLNPLLPVGNAMAQDAPAALLTKPMLLPDMALGSAKAPVFIAEFASMSCPHCAAFEQNVFPMLRSKYIDTGKVRFVFREFPLDIKAVAISMLARCIGNGDPEKFFGAIDTLFKQQDQLMAQTLETLRQIGQRAGMSDQGADACVKDQVLLDKLAADQKFANEELKVEATPTFFINGTMFKGAMSFEELEEKIKPLLKK